MKGIRIDKRPNGVLEICLNRPEAGNRFDVEMLQSLHDALTKAQNGQHRIVLITHAGDAFCLGGMLGDARKQHAGCVQAFATTLKSTLRAISDSPVPVVCALEGNAEGGGLSIVEACDMAIASETVCFAIPEILIGMPPVVSFVSASRVLPEKRLMEMALTGCAMGAEEAMNIGLITCVTKKGEAGTEAEKRITQMLKSNDAALFTIKALKQRIDGGRYTNALDAAGDLLVGVMMHKDTWDMLDRREETAHA